MTAESILCSEIKGTIERKDKDKRGKKDCSSTVSFLRVLELWADSVL